MRLVVARIVYKAEPEHNLTSKPKHEGIEHGTLPFHAIETSVSK
jgi:hypothetical protein